MCWLKSKVQEFGPPKDGVYNFTELNSQKLIHFPRVSGHIQTAKNSFIDINRLSFPLSHGRLRPERALNKGDNVLVQLGYVELEVQFCGLTGCPQDEHRGRH